MGIFEKTLRREAAVDVTTPEHATENLTTEDNHDPLADVVTDAVPSVDDTPAEPVVIPAIDDVSADPVPTPLVDEAPAVVETPAETPADDVIAPEPAIDPVPAPVDPEPVIEPIEAPVEPVPPVVEDVVETPMVANETVTSEDTSTQQAEASLENSANTPVGAESLTTDVPQRTVSSKAFAIINQLDVTHRHDQSVRALHAGIDQLQLLSNLSQVAKEHNLSAPLVAAFKTIPTFNAALENFPSQDVFNIIPEHASTPNNVLGLEAFETATTASSDALAIQADDVVNAFASVLNGLVVIVPNLMDQLHDNRDALDQSDVTDEVLSGLPVNSISHPSFATLLTSLESHLQAVETFTTDELRAYPEKVKEEIDSIQEMVTNLGGILGMGLDDNGLTDAPKSDDYNPSATTFSGLGIDKAGLVLLLSKADSVLDALKAIADRKDELVAALSGEVSDMPSALDSDDVTYGKVDHTSLLGCYTTLVVKLIREAVLAVSMLLTTVDSVLDIDDGLDG